MYDITANKPAAASANEANPTARNTRIVDRSFRMSASYAEENGAASASATPAGKMVLSARLIFTAAAGALPETRATTFQMRVLCAPLLA
jgi:hypothetical protein